MPTFTGSVRRLLFTPKLADVTFAGRGFPVEKPKRRLEAIPQAVVCGFEWAIDCHDQWEVEARLALVEQELRGFAYEGATMAFTILDAMGRGRRTRALLDGPGQPHLLLAYIGIGFAMARLPRPLWKKVLPDLAPGPFHPTMSWLAVDGYGFDLAYFHTRRWVDRQESVTAYPWQGCPRYFPRAFDQGLGRALWFIHNGDVSNTAAAVNRFAEHRRADLWSGVGLAATFAGGCPASDAIALRELAAGHAPSLALGSVFATSARAAAGYLPSHTTETGAELTGLSSTEAVELAMRTAVSSEGDGSSPAYELWRERIRGKFAETA
ncbi:DUF1702 family protein [Amycolatopsis sp. NPDC049868]|uniref:DUF1702 family protein n=1 Tax=Amycolatopsis sp. NPDC049868 TaxID=3363934 RepID=UPI00378AA257